MLCGIAHVPHQLTSTRGVLVLVGGPQYRVGSHRQFVLLARALAGGGVPVMRFDYRGIGDSEGARREFDHQGPDVCSAVDAFLDHCRELTDVVVWGLCDGASGAMLHASLDERISGLILVNPWVRTRESFARSYLRHYYLPRLLSRSLWTKTIAGELDFGDSLRSLWDTVKSALRPSRPDSASEAAGTLDEAISGELQARMAEGLAEFSGPIMLILSGRDLTAREFIDTVSASPTWRRLLKNTRVIQHTIDGADHTFSSRVDRDKVARLTWDWLQSW